MEFFYNFLTIFLFKLLWLASSVICPGGFCGSMAMISLDFRCIWMHHSSTAPAFCVIWWYVGGGNSTERKALVLVPNLSGTYFCRASILFGCACVSFTNLNGFKWEGIKLWAFWHLLMLTEEDRPKDCP